MTAICDGQGKRLLLPDDLKVANCHQCERLSVGHHVPRAHRLLVRDHIQRGRMGRLVRNREEGQRPLCTECRHVLRVLGGAA